MCDDVYMRNNGVGIDLKYIPQSFYVQHAPCVNLCVSATMPSRVAMFPFNNLRANQALSLHTSPRNSGASDHTGHADGTDDRRMTRSDPDLGESDAATGPVPTSMSIPSTYHTTSIEHTERHASLEQKRKNATKNAPEKETIVRRMCMPVSYTHLTLPTSDLV